MVWAKFLFCLPSYLLVLFFHLRLIWLLCLVQPVFPTRLSFHLRMLSAILNVYHKDCCWEAFFRWLAATPIPTPATWTRWRTAPTGRRPAGNGRLTSDPGWRSWTSTRWTRVWRWSARWRRPSRRPSRSSSPPSTSSLTTFRQNLWVASDVQMSKLSLPDHYVVCPFFVPTYLHRDHIERAWMNGLPNPHTWKWV